MRTPTDIFGRDRALVGMVHVGALPGTPFAGASVAELGERAAGEASVLDETGFDAVMIENMHDRPYVWGGHGAEITAAMTAVGLAVRGATDKPLGVQVLSGGHLEALAVALAIGAAFIRCENFVFAEVADEGLVSRGVAGELLRERRRLGAEQIAVLGDIQKKHASHAMTADVSIGEHAEAAEFFGVDGLIVTGRATGKGADLGDLKAVRAATRLPVAVGSGVTPANVAEVLVEADAVIVGSSLKVGGIWTGPVDPEACRRLVGSARA